MLQTKFLAIELKNPLVLASGILGVSAQTMTRVSDTGAGLITLKSISHEERLGNNNPTILTTPNFMMNAVGLSGVGVDNAGGKVKKLKDHDIPVMASVFSDTFEKTAYVAKKFEEYGVDAIEINVSCPHVQPGEHIGIEIGKDPKLTEEVTSIVRKAVSIPVVVKLSPNVTDIVEIGLAAQSGGADAVTAVNTFGPGMKIDIDSHQPILHNKLGGVSGPGIFPLALAHVWKLYEALDIPIIGMGGVTTYHDAIEMIMAGATLVGMGTSVYYEGFEVFSKVESGIIKWMKSSGFSSLDEIRGIAHTN